MIAILVVLCALPLSHRERRCHNDDELYVLFYTLDSPSGFIIRSWPYSILSRREYSFRVQRVLDLLVQLHLRIVIEAIRIGNLVHQGQMCSVFSPTMFRTILNQSSNKPMCFVALFYVVSVVDYAYDVMHFSHA